VGKKRKMLASQEDVASSEEWRRLGGWKGKGWLELDRRADGFEGPRRVCGRVRSKFCASSAGGGREKNEGQAIKGQRSPELKKVRELRQARQNPIISRKGMPSEWPASLSIEKRGRGNGKTGGLKWAIPTKKREGSGRMGAIDFHIVNCRITQVHQNMMGEKEEKREERTVLSSFTFRLRRGGKKIKKERKRGKIKKSVRSFQKSIRGGSTAPSPKWGSLPKGEVKVAPLSKRG